MITVATKAAAEGRDERPVGAGAGRQIICPAGAKTRGEAWQRAAECYAELFGLPDKSVVIVRDGSWSSGDESTWIISRSVDGRYSSILHPERPVRLAGSTLPPYSRPAGDVEFVVKPDWEA